MMPQMQCYYTSDVMQTNDDYDDDDHHDDNPWKTHTANVADLRKVVDEELDSVQKSYVAAARNLYQIKLQIKAARANLEATQGVHESRINWDEEAELSRLRKEVRTLKNKIPYSLIYPSSPGQLTVSGQLTVFEPNVVWHPRSRVPRHPNASEIRPTINDSYGNPREPVASSPSLEELKQSLNSLNDCSKLILSCMSCFPENAIIKRSLLFNCLQARSTSSSPCRDDEVKLVISLGFLEPIYKPSTSYVSGYLMPPNAHTLLRSDPSWTDRFIDISSSSPFGRDIIYSEPKMFPDIASIEILLLGKWRRSLPIRRHFEIEDPAIFFKGMEKKLIKLKYLSLRDISMITELPQFITKLKELEILDCKACHNLEIIPNNINKLWRTLTHLDISECYFLAHMPTTLSNLVHLKVLKGFYIGQSNHRKSCSLRDLTKLSKLKKLLIYTSVKEFPNTSQLRDLQRFGCLRNLTISWRVGQTHDTTTESMLIAGDDLILQSSFNLEKLDLHCVPNTVTRAWLNPVVFKGLKKLYIRGGSFFDLGQSIEENTSLIMEEDQWTVEILRLKHLRELKMDKSELDNLFPKLISLETVDCRNLTSVPCDRFGTWLKSTHLAPSTSSVSSVQNNRYTPHLPN